LDGVVYRYDSSQKALYKTLKDFYLKILKSEIKDFDKDLIKIIKQNIAFFYPKMNSSDDLQYLISWMLSAVNEFFQTYPLSKYTPLIANHTPIVDYNSLLITLNFDLILVQNNQLAFIHAICFYPKLDSHNETCDFFNVIKLDFLKSIYPRGGCSKPSVRLHNTSIKPASFRNKNIKNYPYTKNTITALKKADIVQAKMALNYFNKNKDIKIIKPFCDAYDCPKRKECRNA
jgi:hypothetical protein